MTKDSVFLNSISNYEVKNEKIDLILFKKLYFHLFPENNDKNITRNDNGLTNKLLSKINNCPSEKQDLSLRLFSLLCTSQPFYDGNHRTTFLLYLIYCKNHNIDFDYMSFLENHYCRELFSIIYIESDVIAEKSLCLLKQYTK